MTCHDVSPLIDPYLDGELGGDEAADVARHLDACASCRGRLEERRALSALLRRLPYYSAPAPLQSTISRARNSQSARRRVQTWLVAAAVIVVAAGAVVGVPRARRAQLASTLAEAVIERHVSALAAPSLIQIESTDQHTVKPWFQGKLEFSPPVPDLAAAGFELVGGRVDSIDGRTAAVLVYRRRLHIIHVFVWPGYDARSSDARTIRGFHERNWTSGDLSFWAVSDVNEDDLRTFADAFTAGR